MHDYGILNREGISIDNSVIKGYTNDPYNEELINSVAKYAEVIKLPIYKGFIDGVKYSIKGNKFIPIRITYREPRVLLYANTTKSYLPKYSVSGNRESYLIRNIDSFAGEELCILHSNDLNVVLDANIIITKTIPLEDNLMATYVIIKKDNQSIMLNNSL